ncbi:MAG: hypothetical protein KC416_16390, partial [Myxococcales bacterium]|nr:hypothetical protein [Myxococcales bacterium]
SATGYCQVQRLMLRGTKLTCSSCDWTMADANGDVSSSACVDDVTRRISRLEENNCPPLWDAKMCKVGS